MVREVFGFIRCLVSLTRLVLQTVTTGKSSGNTGVLVELISTYQNFNCGKHTHIPKKLIITFMLSPKYSVRVLLKK